MARPPWQVWEMEAGKGKGERRWTAGVVWAPGSMAWQAVHCSGALGSDPAPASHSLGALLRVSSLQGSTERASGGWVMLTQAGDGVTNKSPHPHSP